MNKVFVVEFGGKPVAAYLNESAATEHTEHLQYHPDTPNRGWACWTSVPVYETYKQHVDTQPYLTCAKLCRRWAKEHTADAFPEVKETLLALALEIESLAD